MKAVVLQRHGGPEVLEYREWPTPAPGPGEALVRVQAVALNHRDLWVRRGQRERDLPRILGMDIAGTVAALGPGVTGWEIGQPVVLLPTLTCGRCRFCVAGQDNACRSLTFLGGGRDGGYAEYVVVPAHNLFPQPPGLTPIEAAALPVTFLTAWHGLVSRARLRPGETVFIWGASSGLGSAAIQIARFLGARVITTAGTPEKARRAWDLGVDAVIIYRTEDVVTAVRRLTDNAGVDVVLDHVGGATFAQSLALLGRRGRLVLAGATTGDQLSLTGTALFFNNQEVHGILIGTRAEFGALLALAGRAGLRPVIDRVYALPEAVAAHQRLEKGEHFGKIVLVP